MGQEVNIKTLLLMAFVVILGLPGIRTATSPLVYWVLGCLPLALLILIEVRSRGVRLLVKTVSENHSIRLFVLSWVVFLAGISLAAFMNEGVGYATVPKYVALLLIFLALFSLQLTSTQLVVALMAWCAMATVPIVLGLLFGIDMYLVFWPSRVGSLLNAPGELWKAGVFVLPVMMWVIMVLGRPRWYHWLWVILAALAIGFDGSRTAILAVAVFWLLILLVSLARGQGSPLNVALRGSVLALVIAVSMGAMYPSPWNPVVIAQNLKLHVQAFLVEAPVLEPLLANEVVTSNREIASDPARILLLKKGVESSIEHFPFGGGFGSTTVSIEGGPPQGVHMVYLQLLADTGLLSLLAYIAMFGLPLFLILREMRHSEDPWQVVDANAVPLLVVLVYLFAGLFHPISNELSEWGVVLIALSLLLARQPRVTRSERSLA